MSRAEIEQMLCDEAFIVEQIAGLLGRQAPFDAWPDALRVTLALALDDASLDRPEAWKVVTLRRHLFGPDRAVPAWTAPHGVSLASRRAAERLRTDLPARVRHRAGRYLLARARSQT